MVMLRAMEPWRELMTRVEAAHGIVTYDELVGAGASPEQIRRLRSTGRMVPVHRGVYRVAGAPPTFEARVAAALRHLGEDGQAWAAFFTASEMWGLGLAGPDSRIEILRPNLLSAGRSGVVVHRSTSIPPHHVTTLRRLPITTASRTLMDLARSVGPRRLERAVTHALREPSIPCSLASLWLVLYDLGGRGRPGTRRLRADLERRDVAEPPSESVLDDIGRALFRPVPGIRWQVELSDERGYIRRVDGLVPEARLVIEFDSVFHDDPAQRTLDLEGDRRLRDLGLHTRRYRWLDLTRRGDVTLDELIAVVAAAA